MPVVRNRRDGNVILVPNFGVDCAAQILDAQIAIRGKFKMQSVVGL